MHAGRNTNSETNKPQKKNQLITLTVINTAIDSVPQPCDWCTSWFCNVYFWMSFSAPLLGLRFCSYHLSSSFWFIGMAEWEVLPRTARWPHGPVGLHAGPAVCHGEQPASGQQRGPQDQPSSNGGTVESMCVTATHLFRMTQWDSLREAVEHDQLMTPTLVILFALNQQFPKSTELTVLFTYC